ncbi:hypothetical protein AMS68_005236 [Peltaster fructicola]|uniref:Ribosome biogenesis protein NOP53 n=1 Tax=Peltaster fructicola TaxID=286661 RepID=A0A6H0XYL9_9PEZI|nr:hypothetical protein AMS68_005236 [Peltaster fructicola]
MADIAVLAPATHKQPSRKGKKAWRKNVDLTEVQAGLENVRDEIIKGGVISEKTADQLFVVDLAGDTEADKQQQGRKLLKSEEILAQRSAVPGLNQRKRKAADLPVSASKRQKDGKYVSHKELQRLRSVADNAEGIAIEENASHDVWESRRQASMPTWPTPAVRRPEGGKSYNPLVGDWSALLEKEGAAAVMSEQARLAAELAAEEKEARLLAEAAKVEEAERNEYATDYESEWDGFMSESEKTIHTAKQQKRKTPAERNKIKARKEREAREVWERKQKEYDQQQKRIKQIAREVSARDKARRSAMVLPEMASSDEEEPELAKRRFGKVAVPEAPLEVVLPDELQDSLRRLKPEGNLMTDRYRNLLINGKLEVRKRRGQPKQRKTTRTEKWTYKDWTLK